ncbi:hypothetical protein Tco_1464817 [Tanacetum coccineum]
MEPHRSVWRASPGSLLLGKRTRGAPRSCQLPRPEGTPDALFKQFLLVHPDLQLRRCRIASCESYLVGDKKLDGERDPQVRSTLGVQRKECSSIHKMNSFHSVMLSDSTLSIVTYTSVYSDSEPWRFQWVSDAEPQSPEAAPHAPPLPDYVPGPEHPPSPDYVPGLDYIADSDPKEDPEDDPEEDPADYPADEGDEEEEEESSRDDADDKDEDENSEEEDDDEEEEEYLAPSDSSTIPIDDHVPSAEEIEPFKTDEPAPTPPPPRLRRARIYVRPQTPMAAATEALIAAVTVTLPSSSPPLSPLTPL